MKIDYTNRNLINEDAIYVHDYLLGGVHFNYLDDEITMSIYNPELGKAISIIFQDIFCCTIENCHNWSLTDSRILSWTCMEVDGVKENLQKNYIVNKTEYVGSKWEDDPELISSLFTLSSGDTIYLLARSIVYEEKLISHIYDMTQIRRIID